MSRADKQVCFTTVTFMLLHLLAGIGSVANWIPILYLYILNLVSGSLIVGYWLWKQIRITQHIVEMRELSYVSFETLVIGLSAYTILADSMNFIVRIAEYFIATLHVIGLVIFLIFMLTFKITKLF